MSDTTYVDFIQPAVNAEWLNEINDHVWHDTPVNGATVHTASLIENIPSGTISALTVQAALNELDTEKVTKSDLIAPGGSSLVGYIQEGTGAVATLVQTKLREQISVLDFGAVGDGIADDTAAMQAALDSGESLYIPASSSVKVSEVYMTKRHSALYGPGRLIGSVVVDMPQIGDPYQSIIALHRISGVKFVGNSEPIILRRGRGILIDGNSFDDITSSAVVVRPLPADFDGANHCVEDVNICNNICSFVDRLLKIDTSSITAQLNPNWWLGNGDIHVTNNIVRVARISHIEADRVDGLSVKGNTFLHFKSGYPNKEYCVSVTIKGSQVIVSDNELFEPGLAAVRLVETENFNIHGNNIIDCGQLVPSSAIEIVYNTSTPSDTLSAKGTIYGNTINCSTKHAILLSNISDVSVFGNVVRLNQSPVYYGSTPLPPFGDRYGVYTEQSGISRGVLISGNRIIDANTRQYNAFSAVGLTNDGVTRYDESTTATTLYGNYQQVNLAQPSATTITSITDGFEGAELRLITFNGNTTIANNETIKTGTGVNKTLPNDSVFTLTKYGSVWYLK